MSAFELLGNEVGTEIFVSDWVTVDQAMIDGFAELTGDRLWIHVDRERAAAGPFGGTIAHGFLVLSLLPMLGGQNFLQMPGIGSALNYGLDRVRFLSPVRNGARLRNRIKLLSLENRGPGRALMSTENTIEIDGEPKPAMIAVCLIMALA